MTPAELAAATRAVISAGADAVHLHVRSPSGQESLDPLDVAAVLSAIRRVAPGVHLGISTGAWIVSDPSRRPALIRGWTLLPDFASVNFDEPEAVEVARSLLARGVGVEAGLASVEAAQAFLASRLTDTCLRVLLEPQEATLPEALHTVETIEAQLDQLASPLPCLLHGFGATAWPLVDEAGRRGFGGRIGFEDVLDLPDGHRAETNDMLVRAARDRWPRLG